MIPCTYAFASGLLPLDAAFERRRVSTVHTRSTLSATRRKERAANTAAEIAERKEAKAAVKGKPQLRAAVPTKEPSARPYRKPEPVIKEKRVVRTVSERDGFNLLRKIETNGGRDIIVMMRDSERAHDELAEYLVLNETIVITALNSYGTGKDRKKRLIVAIKQARGYLHDEDRPVVTGARKQKRQEEAQAKQDELASHKRNPKTRVPTPPPTLAEVAPPREDRQIVLEELKQYLGLNTELGIRVMGVFSDHKAAEILRSNTGQRFDAKVKALLAAPSDYHILLAEAGATIRREVRQYDTSATAPTGPTPSIQESPEALARFHSQEEKWEAHKKRMDAKANQVELEADDPEAQAKRERDEYQNAILRRALETSVQPS